MDCRIPLHSEALPRIRVGSGGLSDCVSAYLLQHILRHFMGRVSTYFMGKSFRVAWYSTVIPSNSSLVFFGSGVSRDCCYVKKPADTPYMYRGWGSHNWYPYLLVPTYFNSLSHASLSWASERFYGRILLAAGDCVLLVSHRMVR